LNAEQVQEMKARGYRPRDIYENDPELRGVLDMLGDGTFSNGEPNLFRPLLDHLLEHDTYMLLADYRGYLDAQAEIDRAYRDVTRWTRMSIKNVARAGKFSADRSIREYCSQIWGTRPVPVQTSEASRERH
jgi:starch phosphorylase